jgi:hypothetical protein
MYVKGWARIHLALALQPTRSIALPLLAYSSANLTLLMKRRPFLMEVS